MARKIRVLVIASNNWCAIGPFLSTLIRVGFEVAVVCPSGSPIGHIKNLSARYTYSLRRSRTSITTAIAKWSPDLLVCNDDLAVGELHDIHREASLKDNGPQSTHLLQVIEASLGDWRSFSTSGSKSQLMSVAQGLKIACPPTIIANTYSDVEEHFGQFAFPVVIKLDTSWGGRGVRRAHSDNEVLRSVLELSFPHEWPKSVKQMIARGIRGLSVGWHPQFSQKLNIQHYVRGRPANRAVVCWQGKVLAGVSVEAIETDLEFGPTTLGRIIEHAEMAEVAQKIVASLGLSGFLGFDFMLDDANRAWFLEMNPRVTPTCNLRFKSPSLPAVLFRELTGETPDHDVREITRDVVAIFPNRVSKKAAHIYFDDVPEEEPDFLNACRRSRFSREIHWKWSSDRVAPGRFGAKA